MSYIIGRGRYAGETYPAGSPPTWLKAPNVVVAREVGPNTITQGDAPLTLASANITVGAGSRVRLDAVATWLHGVGASTGSIYIVGRTPPYRAQSGSPLTQDESRTVDLLDVTDPLAAGTYTFTLQIVILGAVGATITTNYTILTAEEIPA